MIIAMKEAIINLRIKEKEVMGSIQSFNAYLDLFILRGVVHHFTPTS